jgi:hypothetical protein
LGQGFDVFGIIRAQINHLPLLKFEIIYALDGARTVRTISPSDKLAALSDDHVYRSLVAIAIGTFVEMNLNTQLLNKPHTIGSSGNV